MSSIRSSNRLSMGFGNGSLMLCVDVLLINWYSRMRLRFVSMISVLRDGLVVLLIGV